MAVVKMSRFFYVLRYWFPKINAMYCVTLNLYILVRLVWYVYIIQIPYTV